VEHVETQSGATPPAVKSFRDFSSVQVACTGLGTSPSLGSLSVPPAWPAATPKPEYTPAVAGKPPGLTYQDGLMGVMTGHRAAASHAEEPLADEE
jgi:PPE-SVP subfamily C-terminal region